MRQTTYLVVAVTTEFPGPEKGGRYPALRHKEVVDEFADDVRTCGELDSLRPVKDALVVLSCECDGVRGRHVHLPDATFPRYAGNAGLGVRR